MAIVFIGRQNEIEKIKRIKESKDPSILIIYGRRRVGKTTLIEHSFQDTSLYKFEGLEGKSKKQQLAHCLYTLSKYLRDPHIAKLQLRTWEEFFDFLYEKTEKKDFVLYLEEIQWLAEYKSDLISDLKCVWDNRFGKKRNFKLILCGSSPSFIQKEVIRSKALYNRSEHIIFLQPFSLYETSLFIGKTENQFETMDAHLAVGGFPEYLKYLRKEDSVYLALLKNSFHKDAFFVNEYDKIFTSSLADNKYYRKIINLLSHAKFATRDQISEKLKISSGGTLSALLEDLTLMGFVERLTPIGATQGTKLQRFKIADPYLSFYFRFIHSRIQAIQNDQIKRPELLLPYESYRQWLGIAFEDWCRRSAFLIAKKLGFESVSYKSGSFFRREDLASGFQIDLVFERKDRVVTICEIKYTEAPPSKKILKSYLDKLDRYPKKKSQTLERVLISAHGATADLRQNFDRVLTLADLFGS